MKNLNGKVVWLTGASSGIGEALAYALAKEGAKLILSSRRKDELNRVAKNISGEVFILPLDLEKQTEFEQKKNEVLAKFGRIDILLNNGGISQRSMAIDTPVEVDRKLFEINFFGTIALTKILLPVFVKQQAGMIVTVTSAVGKFGSPWRSGYSASKHALHGFFDSLRAELHQDHVQVMLVCPGFIQTNVSVNALTATGQKLGTMDASTAKGLTAEACAAQIVSAIKSGKEEIFVGGFKEAFGIYAKRFAPRLFSYMLTKLKVR